MKHQIAQRVTNQWSLYRQLEQGPDWKTEMNFGGGGGPIRSAVVVMVLQNFYGSANTNT